MQEFINLTKTYPFITYLTYGGADYIGIVQNSNDQITTIYDFGSLKTLDQKTKFLNLGEQWWWESNRSMPINVFLKQEWQEFRFSMRILISKDVNIHVGPLMNLKDMANKRGKRRSITLIKRLS